MRTILVAVMLVVAVSVYGLVNQAAADTVPQASGAQVVADMGAGWNLGNQLEASSNGYPGETAWGQPAVTQALVSKVKAAGFRTIRIPVSYLGAIGSGPDYTIDSAWLNRVQQVVDYAYGQGMYVVINMHGDGYKSVGGSWLICDAADQTTIKAKYQKVWQQIAARFQGYDQHLIMESMNEEFDGQYGNPTQPCYSNINSYNQIFVDTVRRAGGNNGSRWLLIPGWNTNIDYTVGNYGFALPTDQYRSSSVPSGEQRIMISAHYYDPWDFTGTESGAVTQWGPSATDPSRTSTWGQEDYLDAQLKKMHDAFVTKGYPVVIGEYGSIDKSSSDSQSNKYRADYAHAVSATATKYGEAAVYWDNGYNGQYGFGLFDRSSYAVTQQGIIDAIMSGVGSSGGTTGGTTTGGTTTGGTTAGGTSGGTGGGSSGPLHATASGKCLDVPGGSQGNVTQVQIYDCSGAANQTWTSTSSKQLTVYGGAKCLDVYQKKTAAGTPVGIYTCNGGTNQQWNINSNGTITSVQSGLCLDVTGASTANGALVELWTCNGGGNQQWKLG